MKNQEVAEILFKVADLLELQDEIRFKYLAYRKAAQTIERLSQDILEIYKKGGIKALEEIPSIGSGIAEKIEEILKTGKLNYLEELKSKIPIDVDSLMGVEGLGSKRIGTLYKKLKIKNIKDLEGAAKQGKIKNIPGFGTKVEENILKAIEFSRTAKQRFVLGFVWPTILELEKKIKSIKYVHRIEICGSVRRRKETIADLDILTISNNPVKVIDTFTKLEEVKRILAKGGTKSTVILRNNMQVDLRVLPKESFGAAMQYFIGDKNHNVKLRRIAISKGYKLSEYGLFKEKKAIAAEDEEEIYKSLGLDYIEPEMREDSGEIELAMKHKIPKLIQLSDIKGDLHMHTNQSDGLNTMEEMIEKAISLGRKYIAISDHTGFLQVAHGLNERQLLKQKENTEKMKKKYGNKITVLSGCEVNIKDNGKPDIRDSILKQLDVVTASIHTGFKGSEEKTTKRTIAAMENPNVDIIGHPTGRVLQKRNPFAINLNNVFEKARETGTCLEINSFPTRLDLKDIHIKEAIKNKIKLVISTDSHEVLHQEFMQFGVWQARRGWAEAKNILNTLHLDKFLKNLK
ncbi:DNA polymerase/3'-5' exonuclease PolX [Candidatus Woesearchaeota archaeon]|nr:DNA polymerase/3'-5' exonuclease PolX [Candidatus Woesearchaeota archaeon]